jgi:hypothetical protein
MEDEKKGNPTPIFDPAPWPPPWWCYWKCHLQCRWWDPPPFWKLKTDQLEKLKALQEKMTGRLSEIFDEMGDKLEAIEKRKYEEVRRIMESKK